MLAKCWHSTWLCI